jgi:hypothetical protein
MPASAATGSARRAPRTRLLYHTIHRIEICFDAQPTGPAAPPAARRVDARDHRMPRPGTAQSHPTAPWHEHASLALIAQVGLSECLHQNRFFFLCFSHQDACQDDRPQQEGVGLQEEDQ